MSCVAPQKHFTVYILLWRTLGYFSCALRSLSINGGIYIAPISLLLLSSARKWVDYHSYDEKQKCSP